MKENETTADCQIDLKYLRSVTENDEIFIIKILEKVIQQIPECMLQMEEHFENNNFDRLRAVAHKMANSMMTVGIKKAEKALHAIEDNIAHEQDLEMLKKSISTVKTTCELAMADLIAEKQNLEKANEQTIN